MIQSIVSTLNPNRSLKARVSLIFGGSTLLLALILSLVVGAISKRQLEQQVGQSLSELAYQMADTLDRGMFERYQDMQILVTRDAIRNPDTLPSRKHEIVETLQNRFPEYGWMGITNANGIVIASTDNLLIGTNSSELPWYTGALSGPFLGDVSEAVLLSDVLPSLTGERLRFVDIATPVYDQRQNFIGIAAAHLGWDWAQEVRESLLRSLYDRKGVEMFVVSQDNHILLSPPGVSIDLDTPLSDIGTSQPSEQHYAAEIWPDGKAYLSGFASTQGYRDYPGMGWTTIVRQDLETAYASAYRLQEGILLIGILVGLVFAALGWWLADYIVAPLTAIARAADRMRQGDGTVTIPTLRGEDEVASLAVSLQNLVDALHHEQEELETLNAELETRVQERTADLQARNEDLDTFAHTVAHDLKHPLNTMIGYSYILMEFHASSLDDEAREALNEISEGARKMANITDELLLLARMHQAEVPVAPVEMNDIIVDVRHRLAHLIEESRAVLTVPRVWPLALGYGPWIAEVWVNYLSNAIKYGGKPPTVEFGSAVQPDGKIRFWLRDNGQGLTQEQQASLFTPYTRLNQVRVSGHGLGLSITQRIIQKLGGEVGVESEPGQGSTFYFTLPAAEGEEDETSTQDESAKEQRVPSQS